MGGRLFYPRAEGPLSTPVEPAVGVSLWLSPTGDPALARLVDELSARLGTPRFPPHLTLLGGLGAAEPEAEERAARLAAGLRPLGLALGGVGGEPSFYRC